VLSLVFPLEKCCDAPNIKIIRGKYLVRCLLSGCEESKLQSFEQTRSLLAESVQNAMYYWCSSSYLGSSSTWRICEKGELGRGANQKYFRAEVHSFSFPPYLYLFCLYSDLACSAFDKSIFTKSVWVSLKKLACACSSTEVQWS